MRVWRQWAFLYEIGISYLGENDITLLCHFMKVYCVFDSRFNKDSYFEIQQNCKKYVFHTIWKHGILKDI